MNIAVRILALSCSWIPAFAGMTAEDSALYRFCNSVADSPL
jgi:hypothetical protein